ncbi:MAG: response regulator [Anaerolineae bacterium]|nr:response regulator [Anaerolineae bacterium]
MIELVRLILQQQGYRVQGCTDGASGLVAARESRPDLILLDLMMPGMDGWEVFRRLKQDADLADTPVIVVTAKAQSIDKMLGLHIAKVDDYITKPFGPQELLGRVSGVLEKSGSRRVGGVPRASLK